MLKYIKKNYLYIAPFLVFLGLFTKHINDLINIPLFNIHYSSISIITIGFHLLLITLVLLSLYYIPALFVIEVFVLKYSFIIWPVPSLKRLNKRIKKCLHTPLITHKRFSVYRC